MKKLLILGASGHGAVCADAACKMAEWEEIVFADAAPDCKPPFSFRLIGTEENAFRLSPQDYDVFVAIGNAKLRMEKIRAYREKGFAIATVIHPTAVIGGDAVIGDGTVLAAQAVVNPRATVGSGCIINTGATVDHDCVLAEGVHISVGAHVAGTVMIGANTWIGIGACVSNNLSICGGCTVAAGAAVIRDITESGTYAGVP